MTILRFSSSELRIESSSTTLLLDPQRLANRSLLSACNEATHRVLALRCENSCVASADVGDLARLDK